MDTQPDPLRLNQISPARRRNGTRDERKNLYRMYEKQICSYILKEYLIFFTGLLKMHWNDRIVSQSKPVLDSLISGIKTQFYTYKDQIWSDYQFEHYFFLHFFYEYSHSPFWLTDPFRRWHIYPFRTFYFLLYLSINVVWLPLPWNRFFLLSAELLLVGLISVEFTHAAGPTCNIIFKANFEIFFCYLFILFFVCIVSFFLELS